MMKYIPAVSVPIIDWEELQCGICGFAKDGEEALVLIREKHPDIVFMDINMSRMNGLEAL